MLPAHLLQIGGAPDVIPRVGFPQQVGHNGCGQDFVAQAFEHGQIFRPSLGSARGHHDLLVPPQNAQSIIEGGKARKVAFEGKIGFIHAAHGTASCR